MTTLIDVLIPTYQRPSALAVTLTSLVAQTMLDYRVIVSDQNEEFDAAAIGEVRSAAAVLGLHGNQVVFRKHLPRKGMAEQRQFLLDQVTAPYALFLDADLILEPYVLSLLHRMIRREGCAFVGSAAIGPGFIADHRPHEEAIEFWEGPVQPEKVEPGSEAWERYRLHNAANLYHVQVRCGVSPETPRTYKVAWVGGCVLYDTDKLRACGGYDFWEQLPADHSGEDVLAQLRVMQRFGGCGVIPSGVFHLDLPTTLPERRYDAPKMISI
jgi:glycosyltransferase involved in cell wall biosynthesis